MIPGREPTERPVIRKVRYDGTNVPGWKVAVKYRDGESETTWQRFDDAMKWARRQVPNPERVHVSGVSGVHHGQRA